MSRAIYHPVYCSFGTMKASDDKFWYNTTVSITSKYDCILPANVHATSLGRPDSRKADIVYSDGYGGVIPVATYTDSCIDLDVEATKLLSSGGLERGVEVIFVNSKIAAVNSGEYAIRTFDKYNGSALSYYVKNDAGEFVFLKHGNKPWSGPGTSLVNVFNKTMPSGITNSWDTTISVDVYFVQPISHLLSYNNKLSVDIIGDPTPYNSTDADYLSTDTETDVAASKLVWAANGKMYKSVDGTGDLPTEDFSDTNIWVVATKGYPQDWLNHLASGKSINFNPLLVGEEGEDYLPKNSTQLDVKYPLKINTFVGGLKSDNVGATWEDRLINVDYLFAETSLITNSGSMDAGSSSDNKLLISSYISQNKPLAETTPLPVIRVLPKAVASNSHSIYKGGMVTNVVTGKVAVGNSANGLESRLLENAEIGCDATPLIENAVVTIGIGTDVYIADSKLNGYMMRRTRVAADLTNWTVPIGFDITVNTSFAFVGLAMTTPSHNTITLNADVSPASKWFVSEVELSNGEIGVGVFGEDISTDKTGTTFADLSVMNVKRTGVFR